MLSKFDSYNSHLIDPNSFLELDSHLRNLSKQPYQYQHPLINELPTEIPGIYTIGGGRQIGKTTLLKQWIAALLSNNTPPNNIVF